MKKSCTCLYEPLLRHVPKVERSLDFSSSFWSPFCSAAMIEEFDLDQDGEINEQEFFAIMSDEL